MIDILLKFQSTGFVETEKKLLHIVLLFSYV